MEDEKEYYVKLMDIYNYFKNGGHKSLTWMSRVHPYKKKKKKKTLLI